MRKLLGLVIVLVIALLVWRQQPHVPRPVPAPSTAPTSTAASLRAPADHLPPEARQTLARIAAGGPFPYAQDGTVFGNYEGLLPARPRGYYHEYTVETPGAHNRGTRRIITGGTPPEIWYYTGDHSRSFRRIEGPR